MNKHMLESILFSRVLQYVYVHKYSSSEERATLVLFTCKSDV